MHYLFTGEKQANIRHVEKLFDELSELVITNMIH